MQKQTWKNKLRSALRGFGIDIRRIPPQGGFQVPISKGFIQNFQYFSKIHRRLAGVPGDFVECGVGSGKRFLVLAHLLASNPENNSRWLWGFDSFKGFPEPTPEDASFRNVKAGEWSEANPEWIRGILKGTEIPSEIISNRINLVPGFFEDTLRTFPQERQIALLHADVDLYKSYKDVLEAFFPKIPVGGAILFDEYHDPGLPGATKAIDEFFNGKGHTFEFDEMTGKYFVFKK